MSGIFLPSSDNKGHFSKADSDSVAFIKTAALGLSIKGGTKIEVGGVLVSFDADTAITEFWGGGSVEALSSQAAVMGVNVGLGSHLGVWVKNNGQMMVSRNFTGTPNSSGEDSKWRLIGGFSVKSPSDFASPWTDGEIELYSLWDLKFRPDTQDPRGMVLVANSFWADIYLCTVDTGLFGYNKHGKVIADGSSPPKIPDMFGGDGVATYGSFTQFEASELLSAVGKRLPSYQEFSALAYGVTEAQSVGVDPSTTKITAGYTSKWGVEQATGNMWVWGRDHSFRPDGTVGWAYQAQTEGRGSLYLQNTLGLVAALFGGSWGNGVDAGSRASAWHYYPWDSGNYVGARGCCDHLRLV